MNFAALEKNIIDVIKEEQIKLGYQKETIRLYYPLVSLNRTLGTEGDVESMLAWLREFSERMRPQFGETEVSVRGERFCVRLAPEAAEYVHANTPDEGFLYDLIAVVSKHHISMEDIRAQFRKYSACVTEEKIETDEFDWLLYFADGEPDNYRYCFKEEMGHIIYHRFSPEDYEELVEV